MWCAGAAVCSLARGGPGDLSLVPFFAAVAPFQPLRRWLRGPRRSQPTLEVLQVAGRGRWGSLWVLGVVVGSESLGCRVASLSSTPAGVPRDLPSPNLPEQGCSIEKISGLETPFLSPPLSGLEEPITMPVCSCESCR